MAYKRPVIIDGGESKAIPNTLAKSINVRWGPYSATGDGSTSDRTSFYDAIVAAEALAVSEGSKAVVEVPVGDYIIDDDLTISSNVELVINGGYLSISDTKTITVTGGLKIKGGGRVYKSGSTGSLTFNNNSYFEDPGSRQVFGSGLTVTFGSGVIEEVKPEWWGAKVNDIAEDSTNVTAINSAITVANSIKCPVVMQSGTYYTDDSIVMKSYVSIVGSNRQGTIINSSNDTAPIIETPGDSGREWKIGNLELQRDSVPSSSDGSGIQFQGSGAGSYNSEFSIYDVLIQNCYTGIDSNQTQCTAGDIRNVRVQITHASGWGFDFGLPLTSGGHTFMKFTQCYANATNQGFRAGHGQFTFDSCNMDGSRTLYNATYGWYFQPLAIATCINCRIEAFTWLDGGACFLFEDGVDVTLIDCNVANAYLDTSAEVAFIQTEHSDPVTTNVGTTETYEEFYRGRVDIINFRASGNPQSGGTWYKVRRNSDYHILNLHNCNFSVVSTASANPEIEGGFGFNDDATARFDGHRLFSGTEETTISSQEILHQASPLPVISATLHIKDQADNESTHFFNFPIARPYKIISIRESHGVAQTTGGACTLDIERRVSGEAAGAGDLLLATPFDLRASANAVREGTLTTTIGRLYIDQDTWRLGVVFNAATNELDDLVVTVDMVPMGE